MLKWPTVPVMPKMTEQASETEWIAPNVASRILGVGNKTLAKLADDGRLAAKRLPSGHRRYDRASVDQLNTDGAAALAEAEVKL